MDKYSNLRTGLLIAMVLYLVYLYYTNKIIDDENMRVLHNTRCHKDNGMNISSIRADDRLKIESVIENYWLNRAKNKSNCSRIWSDTKRGFVRGAMGGAVMGGDLYSALISGVSFGVMSGIMTAHGITFMREKYLIPLKHT